jgi:hypothetical protein
VSALPPAATSSSSFSEPGVVAGRDGTLIANACTANSGTPATLWRSRNFGQSWSRGFSVATSPVGCGDSDAAIGADGYEYTLILGAGVDVYRSRDGHRWEGPAAFPPPHGEDQPDRPWLVTVPQHPNVVYVFNSEIGGNIVQWVSTDHAKTFAGPVPVTGGLNSQAALTLGSRPLVDPTDPARLYEFYETASFAGLAASARGTGPSEFPFSQLWMATSTDAGQHWANQLVLDVPTAFAGANGTLGHLLPATAIDRTGTRYVVLSVQLGTDPATHLYLTHSTSRGGWTQPTRIGETTGSNVMPALAVAGPGQLFVSWYAAAAQDFSAPGASWHELVATTSHGLGARPSFHISRLSSYAVHVGGVDAMGAVGNDIGQNWALRDFQSITVDTCGRPHVAWAADAGGRPQTYVATSGPPCHV